LTASASRRSTSGVSTVLIIWTIVPLQVLN
jgi:hypothetical protein